MSWQVTVLILAWWGLIFAIAERVGIFHSIKQRLTPPAPVIAKDLRPDQRLMAEIGELKNDLDKIKLTLNFKEYKR